MKNSYAITIIGLLFILNAVSTEASWLIDEERFHVSVHGQVSCQDCHTDIVDKQIHPNPEDVNKTLEAFFRLEQCTDCHEDVLDDVNEGTHGGEKITNEQAFKFCIGCHDPHHQLSYLDSATQLDLTQPAEKKCSICHEYQKNLPELSSEDQRCMGCHRFISPQAPQAFQKLSQLCFLCHGIGDQKDLAQEPVNYPIIDVTKYALAPHAEESCMVCHPRSTEFSHTEQEVGDCRQCHLLHDAKVAHDAHFSVACGACHLKGVIPSKENESGQIMWQKDQRAGRDSEIHHMLKSGEEESCRRCHFSGNQLGAAAMVLPAKSIICMPCHAATFSVGDTTTILAMIIFLLGLISLGTVWFSGSLRGENGSDSANKTLKLIGGTISTIFSARIVSILKTLILDGFLQRRLFLISRTRWLIHALIFLPFVLRFVWGLVALVASLWWPEWSGAWVMLDKNHPITAFLFDLTGVMLILGVVFILIRKRLSGSEDKLKVLPKPDWPAYSLLGGIIIVGFILEGMRIAMTASPESAYYAFLGYAISRLFAGTDLTDIYGYMWYLHAILTGAFVAYLPFSRMFHMIMAPVSLAINATSRFHKAVS
jgi:nitrate reductase gamma subunit